MTAGIKHFLTMLAAMVVANGACAQTYNQMTWGFTLPSGSPYSFGANIQGNWYNLGTVSSAGAWTLSPSALNMTAEASITAPWSGQLENWAAKITPATTSITDQQGALMARVLSATGDGKVDGSGATFTGSISGTTLSVSGVTGTIAAGQTLSGTGITADTRVVSGAGSSWTVNNSQSVASTTIRSGSPLYKIAFGSEVIMSPGSGDGYANNNVASVASGVGNHWVISHEADLNNYNQDYPLPNQGGYTGRMAILHNLAVGNSTQTASAGTYYGTLLSPAGSVYALHAGSYYYGARLIKDYTIYDGTSSTIGLFDQGSHAAGLWSAGTYTTADQIVAGTAPRGIYLTGSFTNGIDTTAATLAGNAITGTGYAIGPTGNALFSALTAASVRPSPTAFASLAACAIGNAGTIDVINNGATYGAGATGTAASGGGSSYRLVLCTNARAGTYEWDYN